MHRPTRACLVENRGMDAYVEGDQTAEVKPLGDMVRVAENFRLRGKQLAPLPVLLQVQAGAGAGVVEIAARCPAGANRSNHLVAHLDGVPAPSGNGFADTGTVFDLSTRSFLRR